MAKPAKNTICLWYDGDAEDAARFYAETFPDSSVGAVHRAPADFPSGKKGDVLTVEFTVMGIPCLGLNGGAGVQAQRGVLVPGRDRRPGRDRPLLERDRRQRRARRARAAGARTSGACPGRSRRVVLTEAITDPDPAVAKRAFDAMMTMRKIDVAAIEAARPRLRRLCLSDE